MGLISFWKHVVLALLAFHASEAFAQSEVKHASPLDGPLHVNTSFGAYGPGPAENPDTYIAGQLHPAVDLRARTATPVRAPVSGKIVYYHRLRNSSREPRWIDTFIVLRGNDGRDYILGHVDCTVCKPTELIGDQGAYPQEDPVRVEADDEVGIIADLDAEAKKYSYPEGVGSHLHLGVVEGHMVDERGILLAEYRGGNWGRLKYTSDPATAQAEARTLAYVDPMPILTATTAQTTQSYVDDFISNEPVTVTVKTAARVRDKPTTESSTVLSTAASGTRLLGRWVKGVDASTRWLKVNAGGYVWDGNLQGDGVATGRSVRISNRRIDQVTNGAEIRLTPIPRLTNDNCYQSLDTRGISVVRYFKDDGMWTGIDGQILHFRMSDYLTGQPGIIEVSTDKSVRITSKTWRNIVVNGKNITERYVEVTMNGMKRAFRLYDICPTDGPDGD